jgi:hypothetical protein
MAGALDLCHCDLTCRQMLMLRIEDEMRRRISPCGNSGVELFDYSY